MRTHINTQILILSQYRDSDHGWRSAIAISPRRQDGSAYRFKWANWGWDYNSESSAINDQQWLEYGRGIAARVVRYTRDDHAGRP